MKLQDPPILNLPHQLVYRHLYILKFIIECFSYLFFLLYYNKRFKKNIYLYIVDKIPKKFANDEEEIKASVEIIRKVKQIL
jgi:hypothetical protein